MTNLPPHNSARLGLVPQSGRATRATGRDPGSRVSLSLVVDRDPASMSDGDLARSLAAGDSWAIAETWRRFAPMVLTMAERCFGSKPDAEDLAQEVFYRVFRKAKTLRDPDCLRSFVYSFAVRRLRTELRRRRLRSWLTLGLPEDPAGADCQAPDVESRELLRRFYALLDRLTARDRLVFILRRMESMTMAETAQRLGISVSTVKRSATHASERLSSWIEADPSLASLLDNEGWGR